MIKIRKAVIDDLPAIAEIYHYYVLNSTVTFDLDEKTIEEWKEWFRKRNERYPVFVATLDGQIVGYSSLNVYKERKAYDTTAELSIYIDLQYKGKGIGKKLMEETIKSARELGFHTIVSSITEGNEASILLHEKFGFQRCGCLKEVGNKFNKWQNVFYYQLIL